MKLEDNLSDIEVVSNALKVAPIAMDLVTSICGEYICAGSFRTVFDYNLDDRFVVKLELENTGCNLIEYMIWQEVKNLCGDLAWVKNWFAPVKWISPNGRILVMKKTKPHEEVKKKRPIKVPKFLWDVKPDNFGWIGKNYVCHDYGQFYNMISYPKAMRKVDWDALE